MKTKLELGKSVCISVSNSVWCSMISPVSDSVTNSVYHSVYVSVMESINIPTIWGVRI